MTIPDTKIAVTLFNLREHCKTYEDLDKTLERVKNIGYEAVQISGIGPIPPEKVKELLDRYQLYVCATHERIPALRDNFDAVVEKMKLWGCSFTALGSVGNFYERTEEGAKGLAKEMSELGAKFKEQGLQLGVKLSEYLFGRPKRAPKPIRWRFKA